MQSKCSTTGLYPQSLILYTFEIPFKSGKESILSNSELELTLEISPRNLV